MASVWKLMVVVMVVAMAAAIGRVGAQLPDCASQVIGSLSSCLDAVTNPTTKPSSDCCEAASVVGKNQMKCLCTIYNSPSAGASLNMTRVLDIFFICKVFADFSLCTTGGSSTPTAAESPPSPSSSTVPALTSVTIECRKGLICHKGGYTVLVTGKTERQHCIGGVTGDSFFNCPMEASSQFITTTMVAFKIPSTIFLFDWLGGALPF